MTWLACWLNDRRVAQLRAALVDAITHCPRCNGQGVLFMPGGRFTCPLCGYWRRVLGSTR